MATRYYGLRDSDGNLVQKRWTSLPVFDLHIIAPYSSFQNGHLYSYVDTGNALRYPTTYYQGAPYNYSQISKGASTTVYADYSSFTPGNRTAYKVTSAKAGGIDIGYELTKTASVGDTVYSQDGTDQYTIVEYYVFALTITTNPVDGTQVGNIAICNASSGDVRAGSISTTAASGTSTYTASFASLSSTIRLKIVATAVVGSTTAKKTAWHQKYFFNGLYKDGNVIDESDITFTESTASYTVSIAGGETFVCDYGAKHALAIAKGTGVSSSTVSYARHHSTGDYVSSSISPVSLSGSGTLYVEHGSNVSASASCESGYVFGTGNGFISQTSGVNSIYGSNSASISGTIAALAKAASFNITASTYTISVSISDHPTWGSVYIDTTGTTSKTLVEGTTYTFYFASSRDDYEAPTVAAWHVNGTAISGNTYTAGTLSGNVAVTCTLSQNAWPVTVSAGSNGTARISGRYNKTTGAQLANTGYLRADGTDYIKLAVTPAAHYDVSQVSKSGNIAEYAAGGDYAYSLSTRAAGTINFYFALAECVIRTVPDEEICWTSPSSTTLRFDAETGVTLYCQLKPPCIDLYRMDYFEAGGAQYPVEMQTAGRWYYVVYASILGGKSELSFVPHFVSTSNTLTVAKSGETSFATIYVQVDGGEEETVSGTSWNAQVRENRPVIIRAVAAFGGVVSSITPSGITDPSITESQISFAMPSNDARVNFAISEKAKVTLALCVANATNPSVAVGKVVLTCPASAAVHEEVATLAAQSFNIYKATTYTLTADDTDATYTFSGWYLNDSTFVSSDLSISINRSDNSSKYTARYVMRRSGTITVSYGLMSGDDVTPVQLPESSLAFGLAIDTPPDQTNPDKWVIGNNRYIDFHVLDDGTSVESGITYIWTPVRVDVMANDPGDTWSTVWTYDANNPESRSGRFVMRDNMLVRLVFTKVQAEGYARVQALFVDGNTGEMGDLSIFATGMLSYNSIGGVAEAACYVGRKVVLAAAPKPGYAFGGWFKKVEGAFVPVESNGAVLTIDTVASSGCEYYADFARSDSTIRAWNDGAEAKTFEWRSKVFAGAQFLVLRNVRVYSGKYPVTLTLMTATSPNGCFEDGAHALALVITNQSPRQIPAMRLEKYFAFKVEGAGRIDHVGIASSMEGLK